VEASTTTLIVVRSNVNGKSPTKIWTSRSEVLRPGLHDHTARSSACVAHLAIPSILSVALIPDDQPKEVSFPIGKPALSSSKLSKRAS
jgi:hypothetical protein